MEESRLDTDPKQPLSDCSCEQVKTNGKKKKKKKKNAGSKAIEGTGSDPSTIEPTDHRDGVEELCAEYGKDVNIDNIKSRFKQEVQANLRKKLYSKLRTMKENRSGDSEDNVQYDARGRKIGRVQKQYVNVPAGEIKTPSEKERLRKILSSMSDQPQLLQQFMQRTGLSEQAREALMSSAPAEDSSETCDQYHRVEEVL